MPSLPKEIWDQIKNTTKKDWIKAIKRDGWVRKENKGKRKGAGTLAFRHPDKDGDVNRIVIHFHPKQTVARAFIHDMITRLGWDECKLRELGMVK